MWAIVCIVVYTYNCLYKVDIFSKDDSKGLCMCFVSNNYVMIAGLVQIAQLPPL